VKAATAGNTQNAPTAIEEWQTKDPAGKYFSLGEDEGLPLSPPIIDVIITGTSTFNAIKLEQAFRLVVSAAVRIDGGAASKSICCMLS
jgi:hypothetical protein